MMHLKVLLMWALVLCKRWGGGVSLIRKKLVECLQLCIPLVIHRYVGFFLYFGAFYTNFFFFFFCFAFWIFGPLF